MATNPIWKDVRNKCVLFECDRHRHHHHRPHLCVHVHMFVHWSLSLCTSVWFSQASLVSSSDRVFHGNCECGERRSSRRQRRRGRKRFTKWKGMNWIVMSIYLSLWVSGWVWDHDRHVWDSQLQIHLCVPKCFANRWGDRLAWSGLVQWLVGSETRRRRNYNYLQRVFKSNFFLIQHKKFSKKKPNHYFFSLVQTYNNNNKIKRSIFFVINDVCLFSNGR